MTPPKIVSAAEWLEARRALMTEEKALTQQRDAVSRARRSLPWVEVSTDYRFDTVRGPRSLAELFDGRSQLVVQHFMFGPDWDAGCPSCSFWSDSFDRLDVHLAHRDTSFVVMSRAPLDTLQAYRARMGWEFDWVSSHGTSFNQDFGVSFEDHAPEDRVYNFGTSRFPSDEAPGVSVFATHEGRVYHTYSTFSRGLDPLNAAYQLLDLTPKGRDEADLPYPMAWLRRRDEYGARAD